MTEGNFTNEQVDIASLPRIEHVNLTELDKRYLTAELAAIGIFWSILGSGAFVLIFLNLWDAPDWLSYIIIPALITIIISSFVYTILAFKRKKYALRERDILYQSGLLWRSYTVVPFNRIQHAEVHQGPLERMFDLGKLKIYTAGGSSSDLSISGLPLDRAHSMKDFILTKSTSDEEE